MSTPNGFICLTYSDGRVWTVSADVIGDYVSGPHGAWVTTKGAATDDMTRAVKETPEQISAILCAVLPAHVIMEKIFELESTTRELVNANSAHFYGR